MQEIKEKTRLRIIDCGRAKYSEILQLQHRLLDERRSGLIDNTVLVLEHEPVVTFGARTGKNKLLVEREELARKGIDVEDIRRGGGTTAHNPGQMVFYPILELRSVATGVSEYVRMLEAIGIELLEEFGVQSQRRKGFPGLWVGEKKIASIGVRITKGFTFHGMAINICNDLSIFDNMVPCGLDGVEMTSAAKETGEKFSMSQVKKALSELLVKYFQDS